MVTQFVADAGFHHVLIAVPGSFHDDVLGAADLVGIGAIPANQPVDAATAQQGIVSLTALQGIEAVLAVEQVVAAIAGNQILAIIAGRL